MAFSPLSLVGYKDVYAPQFRQKQDGKKAFSGIG
jgi:hypothetical protein